MTSGIHPEAVGPGRLGFARADDHDRARDALERAGYSDKALRAALDLSEVLESRALDAPRSLRRTREPTPLHTLIRLFFLGVPVATDAATGALASMPLEPWLDANLLARRDEQVVPLVRLTPYHGLFLAADLHERIGRQGAGDFVLGVNRVAALLAHARIRRPARRTLDLGTGCGTLALLASRHSDHVVATDKNARAVAFARFNARLNGVVNVECATGSLFEPVAGQRFDLVLSNPPYVIAPSVRYMFRDSGVRGDEFCRRLVQDAAGALEEGGFCQLVANWAQSAGQSWQDAVEGWFDGTGCDVLVWGSDTQDASRYATSWIQQTEAGEPSRLPELYETWMGFYEREGIEAITYGVITMRRSCAGRTRVRFVKMPTDSAGPGGDHILRRFRLQDFLDAMPDDDALLDVPLRLAPDVRLEQHYAPGEGGLSLVAARLHLARDPAYHSMEIDTPISTLVTCYRSERRPREVFTEMASATGIDLERLVPGGLGVVRRLLQEGYLVPSGLPED